ncbi:3-dehydroquinate synthase II family protein [Saccharothrix obliqua]|uniref:3-dehydroquinate synthase II family protein n=1 Tax=Saccharothrix obliqua TaxID=2861747 RepID=UPI001C5F580A|nr:3-dehydroquinate synthase II [Saccharothrix obliqua]MBW4721475.1 3-dehydroquinate synthase II [Saccharothrix obliqua]
MKFAWIDLRTVAPQQREAVVDAAVHARLDGVLDHDDTVLATLPPTVRRITTGAADPDTADIRVVPVESEDDLDGVRALPVEQQQRLAAHVHVVDDRTLRLACAAAIALPWTVVKFRDPTKIPLEIVIAAADRSEGRLVCEAASVEEAGVIVDVLEKGSDGILFAPSHVTEVFELADVLGARTPELALTKLSVVSIKHIGLGDRVCVDTTSHFEKDEGILVGSFAHGFVLCASETHPLPYMPTRPFRVNAGALHSYVLGMDNRTNYLSELRSGSTVLAVAADGRTRRVAVGRAKLESRPLLAIDAVAEDGTPVSLTVQDDWHVRVLGPGGAVCNVTELKPGDQLLGHVATDRRHVGWPVGEFCVEQ